MDVKNGMTAAERDAALQAVLKKYEGQLFMGYLPEKPVPPWVQRRLRKRPLIEN